MPGFSTQLRTSLGLFVVFLGIYFFTYQGRPISTDELILFDASHSFTQFGTLDLHYTADLRPFPASQPAKLFYELDSEPLQAYIGAAFMWLALHLPGIGLMQTLWTFNLFVTAFSVVLLYHYALLLGYRPRSGLLAAIAFGLATYAWVYSKFFFREPLFVLLALLCAYSFERLRRGIDHARFYPGWLALSLVSFIAAYFAKQTIFLLVPMFVVIAFPTLSRETIRRRAGIIVALVVILSVLVVLFRFLLIHQRRTDIDLSYLPVVLPPYLISPGFSLWAFSPVLLLGLGGAILLIRRKHYREFIVPLTALLTVTVGYALVQREYWYGGVGWGPRYLLPLTPFMMLWVLPVFDRLLERILSRWAAALTVGVIVLSILVQVVAVSISTTTFSDYLSFESANLGRRADNPIAEWREGTWNLLYIPGVVMAQQARTVDPGFAWASTGAGATVIPLCLLVIVVGVLLLWRTRQPWRSTLPIALLAFILLCACFYVGLRAYAADPFYTGNYTQAFQVLDKLKTIAQPGDAIILNDSFYRRVFMNYYRGDTPVYELSDAPGERLGANAAPEVITDNPEGQAPPSETLILARLAAISSRWWFITEFGPYSQGRLRPTENFLDRHYYPVQEVLNTPDLRLIEYAPISAPADGVPPWPSRKIGADFGAVYLIGADLPSEQVRAGSILPVSLLWRHDQWPSGMQPFDYSVNVSLVSPAGSVVAQQAGLPVGGFGQISQWLSGSYYRDNHGLALPADLPPGTYELWVVVYNWQDNSRLPINNLPSTPDNHLLIARIQVTS